MKRTLILSVVLLVVLMAQGFAQPVVLTCTAAWKNSEHKLTFDEAAGTASWADEDSSSASFTDREITWKYRKDEGAFVFDTQYTLSRMTGTLTVHQQCYITQKGFGCTPNSQVIYQCEAFQKKF